MTFEEYLRELKRAQTDRQTDKPNAQKLVNTLMESVKKRLVR